MRKRSNIGVLVRLDYCIGCQTCQVACQDQNELDVREHWLESIRRNPKVIEGTTRMTHVILPEVDKCAECAEDLGGVDPLCVQNCSLDCLVVGRPEDLIKQIKEEPLGTWQLTF